MAPWLQVLEAYLVAALLRTPAFHRGVEKVAKQVHRIRHGIPPEEMGGTKIDQPGNGGFLRHFTDEVQSQLGRAEARQGALKSPEEVRAAQTTMDAEGENAEAVWKSYEQRQSRVSDTKVEAEVENADTAWTTAQKQSQQPAKQGFMGEYMGALRDQLRNGK